MWITKMNAAKELEEKLREAACFGDLILLKELILKGVNVNSRNDVNGWTALHWAACRNNVEAVALLLNSGADRKCLTSKGEPANSLSSSNEIHLLLGGDSCLKKQQDLPIVPNYIRNPPLTCLNINNNGPINKSFAPVSIENVSDLVLKIKVAESLDPDFIEVELPKSELTFEKLKEVCCQELEIEPNSVSKIRKLPNSVIRNDKDVKRLKQFEEIEIVKIKLTQNEVCKHMGKT